jgi:3D (Asp-Asp-Asp) domain-containing protein
MNYILITIITVFLFPVKIVNVYVATPSKVDNPYETVTLTTYSPTLQECDSTPNITASGFKINLKNPKKHRIIAVSRDLKKKWKFGTRVRIKNAGKYNGIYTVKDVMNKRYKNRIDLLIGEDDKHTRIKNVKIVKI